MFSHLFWWAGNGTINSVLKWIEIRSLTVYLCTVQMNCIEKMLCFTRKPHYALQYNHNQNVLGIINSLNTFLIMFCLLGYSFILRIQTIYNTHQHSIDVQPTSWDHIMSLHTSIHKALHESMVPVNGRGYHLKAFLYFHLCVSSCVVLTRESSQIHTVILFIIIAGNKLHGASQRVSLGTVAGPPSFTPTPGCHIN